MSGKNNKRTKINKGNKSSKSDVSDVSDVSDASAVRADVDQKDPINLVTQSTPTPLTPKTKLNSLNNVVDEYYSISIKTFEKYFKTDCEYIFSADDSSNLNLLDIFCGGNHVLKASFTYAGIFNTTIDMWYWAWIVGNINIKLSITAHDSINLLASELLELKEDRLSPDNRLSNVFVDDRSLEDIQFKLRQTYLCCDSSYLQTIKKVALYALSGACILDLYYDKGKLKLYKGENVHKIITIILVKIVQSY